MAVDLGKIMLLFVDATTGKSGGNRFLSSQFTQCLLVTALSVNGTRVTHDISTRDNVFKQINLSGRRSMTVSVTCMWNYTGDAGQEIVETAWLADTQALSLIACLLTTDVAGDKERYFDGRVTNFTCDYPDEGPATLTFDLIADTTTLAIQDAT